MIEILDIAFQLVEERSLAEDQQAVQALAPQASVEVFTEGVRFRGKGRGVDEFEPGDRVFKLHPVLSSLSQMRKRGPYPNGVALRRYWATQESIGVWVTPTCAARFSKLQVAYRVQAILRVGQRAISRDLSSLKPLVRVTEPREGFQDPVT